MSEIKANSAEYPVLFDLWNDALEASDNSAASVRLISYLSDTLLDIRACWIGYCAEPGTGRPARCRAFYLAKGKEPQFIATADLTMFLPIAGLDAHGNPVLKQYGVTLELARDDRIKDAVVVEPEVNPDLSTPLDTQVGGEHYKAFAIEPLEFSVKNNLDFPTGNVVKYVVRNKGDTAKRIEDLNKAKHYLDVMIAELEGKL